jgi:hypothetical protein
MEARTYSISFSSLIQSDPHEVCVPSVNEWAERPRAELMVEFERDAHSGGGERKGRGEGGASLGRYIIAAGFMPRWNSLSSSHAVAVVYESQDSGMPRYKPHYEEEKPPALATCLPSSSKKPEIFLILLNILLSIVQFQTEPFEPGDCSSW